MATDMTIANTIWAQIAPMTKMAIAAREPVGDARALIFRVTIRPGTMHKVRVELNGMDLYDVQLFAISTKTMKVVKSEPITMVHAEALSEAVYRICTPNDGRKAAR